MRIVRFFMVSVIVMLGLVACERGHTVTPEEIMDGVRATREKTRDVHTIAEVVTRETERDGSFVVESWLRKSGKTDAAGEPLAQSRIEVREASKAELVGSVMVNDGETVWLYNPHKNQVITGKLSDLIQGDVGAQNPASQLLRMEEQLQQLLDGSDVEILDENDPVAGLDAWRVRLTPKPETAEQMRLGSLVETMVWIEHDRYLPLKTIVDAGDLGKVEATVRRIAVDMGIDDQRFRFTPPAGAEIVDAAELAERARPRTTTLDDARASVSFELLTLPTLPQGVTLDEVQLLGMRGETVIQNYSGSIAFSLVQTTGPDALGERDAPFGAATREVTVRGQPGTMVTGSENEQGTLLRWEENGVTIVIAGTLTPRDAQALAESLQ